MIFIVHLRKSFLNFGSAILSNSILFRHFVQIYPASNSRLTELSSPLVRLYTTLAYIRHLIECQEVNSEVARNHLSRFPRSGVPSLNSVYLMLTASIA